MSTTTRFLDRFLPLAGASHADVRSYEIVIPMRYAECFALTNDGRRVRLSKPRQLVGWCGPAEQRTFVFRAGNRGIEIRVNAARRRPVREIRSCSLAIVNAPAAGIERIRKLITRDGSLAFARQADRKVIGSVPLRIRESLAGSLEMRGLMSGAHA